MDHPVTALDGEELVLEDVSEGWLDHYASVLQDAMHPISRQVVLEDSREIADLAVLPSSDARWPASRVRTGAVVGAVQSGKTASMIGMTARALDTTVNVVVLLAGRQTALWRQTLDRVRGQLVGPAQAGASRVRPVPADRDARYRPQTAYALPTRRAEKDLRLGHPLVFIAMKEVHHLEALGQVLKTSVYPAAARLGMDVNMLVIDDEADDASVADDGVVEEIEDLKQVPRRVIELWEDRGHPGETCGEHVRVTYVAYTATPQANFLQDEDNPLAPKDFVAALRTPGRSGMLHPRGLGYRVPGVRNWYTGADVFYALLGDVLCEEVVPEEGLEDEEAEVTQPDEVERDLAVRAIRAYLTAAAVATIRSGRMGPVTASRTAFTSRDEVREQIAPVMSMLIHPASDTESHFEMARLVRGWWTGGQDAGAAGVLADLAQNEAEWAEWLDSYASSATALQERVQASDLGDLLIPDWDKVRRVIEDEIVPATSIAVVNSHPDADERPDYAPAQAEDGTWRAPSNHSTIFISGNVMSRGLTLEGLLTTVFTRAAKSPLADSQMQMQRWFGYRGKILDLCRVFLTPTQRSLFHRYAAADEALRTQVLAAMDSEEDRLPDFTVLQGSGYRATGKVSNLKSAPLLPGFLPVVRQLNEPEDDLANQDVVRQLVGSGPVWTDRRGLLLDRELSLIEMAGLLDSLRYTEIGADLFEVDRWAQAERLLGVDRRLNPDLAPLYRAPAGRGGKWVGARSPYVIAAYLRFWAAALDRNVPGLMVAGQGAQRWNLLEPGARHVRRPRFRVGVRFGGGQPVSSGPLGELGRQVGVGIRTMERDVDPEGQLVADWGSRTYDEQQGYLGDDVFDAMVLGEQVDRQEDGSRSPGSPGLVLFEPIARDADRVSLAVALSIPSGGPDYVAAINGRRKRVRQA